MPFFLNPSILTALAAVGVPILIHLIRRRRQKIVRWAAMDFLRQSQKKQRRRLRIEEFVLLAIRMLIVALAVLAFARPVLRSLGIPLLSQNQRIYAVIVLDNSLSMDFRDPADGKRSFDKAQAVADDVLAHVLKSGDAASLVLLADKPTLSVGAPSFDRNLVRQRARAATVSDRATDYAAAAVAVERLLKASKIPVKEVYWISDDQAPAWESSARESARGFWSDIGKQARVTWVSVGPGSLSRDNLAVSAPVLSSELVTPQLPTRIESRIVNYGARAKNDLLVNLIVDGKPQGTDRVSIPAKGAATARFHPRFVQTGTHVCRVELAGAQNADGLTRDNSAPFVVRSRERIKVLIQDMRPTGNPLKSESFYLLNAMAPMGAAESLTPRLREGEGFSGIVLRDFDTVILAGVSRLSANDRSALADYVKAGGGLLVFPGPATDARGLNADLDAAGLLPARLGARRSLGDADELTLNPGTISHPALALFKDTSTSHLDSARFSTYFTLEPESPAADPNAVRVMVRFSNNQPAFVERKVGLGKVILAASSSGSGWNQLPLKPSFIPFIYQVVSYLGQGPASHRNLRQDEPLIISLPLTDANKSVRVIAPDGRVTSQNSVLDERGVTFTDNATGRAGIYRLSVQGSTTTDAFAVGLPEGESNLTFADPLLSLTHAGVPNSRLTVLNTGSNLQAVVRHARYGTEIWQWLIWPIFGLLLLENFLAQRWGRRG